MNFAQVAVAQDATSIGLGNGVHAVVTPQARARVSAASGRNVTMGLRPEHVRPALGGEPAVAEGVVELVEPLGAETLVLLRLGDALMTGRFPPEVKLKTGDRVPVQPSAGPCASF